MLSEVEVLKFLIYINLIIFISCSYISILKSTARNQFLSGSGVVSVDGGRIGKMIEG
jgi:hypothetical protein